MVVFSNHRLGASAEILVSREVAVCMLHETADAARPVAESRWERELVAWLDDRARRPEGIDANDLAWTPEHFDAQRRFVVDSIQRAVALGSLHETALRRWAHLIDSHPRDSVRFGRRWSWLGSATA
jgi:hypothetical protein